MNTMNCSMKSTQQLPEKEFRNQAVKLIGNVVSAREFISRRGKERVHVSEDTKKPVREQYKLYNKTWTTKGVARFLIRYEYNIRAMSTGGDQMRQTINSLITKAKKYAEIQNERACTY